jgi:hypothetical protein
MLMSDCVEVREWAVILSGNEWEGVRFKTMDSEEEAALVKRALEAMAPECEVLVNEGSRWEPRND